MKYPPLRGGYLFLFLTTPPAYGRIIWGNHKVVDMDEEDPIGEINPIRYRSYYYDVETGLYYLRARYYDPETGRFISQDNINYLDPEHLSGLNLYAYCNDNPVMYEDPDGYLPKWAAWLISGVLVVGGVALSVVTAGVATPGVIGALATIGGIVGGAAVGAGAGSLIGGYVNEASGGSFEAGYVGGLISGSLTGMGASIGGLAMGVACESANIACIGYLSVTLASSFIGGALGDFGGNYVISKMDNNVFDATYALQSALFSGSLNMLAGIGSGMASAAGGVCRDASAAVDTKIAARLIASMIIVGTEAAYDLISYLIRKVF